MEKTEPDGGMGQYRKLNKKYTHVIGAPKGDERMRKSIYICNSFNFPKRQ